MAVAAIASGAVTLALALQKTIDAIVHIRARLRLVKLDIQNKELDTRDKELEIRKKERDFAFEAAAMFVDTLGLNADPATKAMLVQAALSPTLKLGRVRGLELPLPTPQSSGGKTETTENG